MYSSDDFERFYFQYQTEALPTGISIQDFCVKNKVPYNIYSKWYKDTRKKIVVVKLEGFPTESAAPIVTATSKTVKAVSLAASTTRICVEWWRNILK